MLPRASPCIACGRPVPAMPFHLPRARCQKPLAAHAAVPRRAYRPDVDAYSCRSTCRQHSSFQPTASARLLRGERCRALQQAASARAAACQRAGHATGAFSRFGARASTVGSGDAETTEVVIVGGGLAGLAAGLALTKAGARSSRYHLILSRPHAHMLIRSCHLCAAPPSVEARSPARYIQYPCRPAHRKVSLSSHSLETGYTPGAA